jgi:hypothetical protein
MHNRPPMAKHRALGVSARLATGQFLDSAVSGSWNLSDIHAFVFLNDSNHGRVWNPVVVMVENVFVIHRQGDLGSQGMG